MQTPFSIMTILAVTLLTSAQAGKKPSQQGPHVRRVCYTKLPVHLGDSFEEVSRAYTLRGDPNGPSSNSEWVRGRTTDFLWVGPDHKLGDRAVLRPMVSLTFSDRKTLRQVSISWYFDGDCSSMTLDALAEMVISELHPCLKESVVEQTPHEFRGRIDYGTYSEELAITVKPESPCRIKYTIQEQP
jgi:hypothetical protein